MIASDYTVIWLSESERKRDEKLFDLGKQTLSLN